MEEQNIALEDIMKIFQVIRQFRDSEAIVDIRTYLDSMDPEDQSNALQSMHDLFESIEHPEVLLEVLQDLLNVVDSIVEQSKIN